jgi:hypothetical protein
MYCPKCGREMIKKDDHYYCDAGDMYLSKSVSQGLFDTFISRIMPPKDSQWRYGIGGEWYCPADAARMIEDNGYITCPACHLFINEFVYQLIERHPHV